MIPTDPASSQYPAETPLRESAVHLRDFGDGDIAQLISVFEEAVQGLASADYTPAQIAAWAPKAADHSRWNARLTDRVVIVAEERGSIVGFTNFGANGHIDMLFVRPSHARRGIASALIERVVTLARRDNISRLFTEASITARPFFEHQGFEVTTAQDVELQGQWFRNYRMARQLG